MKRKEPAWLFRTIEWYDKKSQESVGERILPRIDLRELQELWNAAGENPMVGLFEIGKIQADYFQEKTGIDFDFENYDYFMGAYTKDLEASQREGGFMGAHPPPKILPAFPQARPVSPRRKRDSEKKPAKE